MSTIPQARFQELLQDIEPSPTTNANASSAHNDLRDFLKNDEIFKEYHVTDFLCGSYKRDTAIRPTKKGDQLDRPDIDIIIVTNHTSNDDPNEVYELLHKTLKKQYEVTRRQNHSVGIKYYKADMDVVPAIAYGNKYLIPDRKANKWVLTDPEKHTQWTTERNNASDGRFKPLVKLIKWYRREHPTSSKKPKGLTLEAMVSECMDYEETDYFTLFVKTLEKLVERYGSCKIIGNMPYIPDPAIPGNSLCEAIDIDSFVEFYDQLKSDSEKARKALDSNDADEATNLMKEVLGDRFPKSPSNGKSNSLLRSTIAGSASFPDRPVKPNKPAGFAHVV
jgi:predicted nucleotidyltransferase